MSLRKKGFNELTIVAEYFCGTAGIKEHVKSWEELANNLSAPNPFFEPWCLLPALSYLESEGVQLLVVWEDHNRLSMLGLVPLVVERKYRGLPIKRTTIWRHAYCFLSTPLIAKDREAEVVQCMLESINANRSLPSFVSLYWLASESPVVPTVTEQSVKGFAQKGYLRTISRAMVTVDSDYDKDFLGKINKKRRKEFKRNKNRLDEQGNLQTVLIDKSSEDRDIENAIQQFVALENTGWKREQGTAIASNQMHQRYFEESLIAGTKRGSAHFVSLRLDETTIASLILIQSANGKYAYTIKIATDVRYQSYSLGTLLILEATKLAFENPIIQQIDSCAAPDHPMINRVWKERTNIVNLNITPVNDYRGAIILLTDFCVRLVRK